MSLAAFIASTRRSEISHDVPHAVSCRALQVSESWFSKWADRTPTPTEKRRAAVAKAFDDARSYAGRCGFTPIYAPIDGG